MVAKILGLRQKLEPERLDRIASDPTEYETRYL